MRKVRSSRYSEKEMPSLPESKAERKLQSCISQQQSWELHTENDRQLCNRRHLCMALTFPRAGAKVCTMGLKFWVEAAGSSLLKGQTFGESACIVRCFLVAGREGSPARLPLRASWEFCKPRHAATACTSQGCL